MLAERKEIKYPPVGEEITGKVDALTNFGVFVKVNDDLRALLHQDEITSKDGRDPDIRAMFNVGDDIKVRNPLTASYSSCRAHDQIRRHTSADALPDHLAFLPANRCRPSGKSDLKLGYGMSCACLDAAASAC